VQRIDVSPLFKIAQNQDLKFTNPLARIFKINDDEIREQTFIPINLDNINRDRYQKHAVNKNAILPNGNVVFFTSVSPHQKLASELHTFDYVY
jgi:hypothetical protein